MRQRSGALARGVIKGLPMLLLAAIALVFATLAPHFLTRSNLGAVLEQSSWLIVVGLGMNFALLSAGVDLSVGATMYLVAVVVGLSLGAEPGWVSLAASVLIGALFGTLNGVLVARLKLLPFIVTLATSFVGRGFGLFLSSTQVVYASPAVAAMGRMRSLGVSRTLWIALGALAAAAVLLKQTPFGTYVRALGADAEGARRAGVPVTGVTAAVYVVSGAFAGLGGFVSLSQTASASSIFGQNAEFLAIAASVLGGTSLFGGRGNLWAPVIGAILIMTVQDGLIQINANPYAYPVLTGAVILIAALLDTLRGTLLIRRTSRRASNIHSIPRGE